MKYLKKFNENIEDSKEKFLDEIKDLIPDILNIEGVKYIFNGDPEISKIPETINHLKLYFKNANLVDNIQIIKSDLSRIYKIMSYEYEVRFIYNKYYDIILTIEDILEILNNNSYIRRGMDNISIVFKNKEEFYKESLSEKDIFLDEIKDLIPDIFSLSKESFHRFAYTTQKYKKPYQYVSFDLDDLKSDDYCIIISDLYRLYGILSNDYKISFSIDIIHPYENHNDIDFKKCIEIINRVKSNCNIWSPRNSINNICIFFEL